LAVASAKSLEPVRSDAKLCVFYPEIYNHVAVVGFELESASGKHAAGGLLNLAAHCTVGVGVAPNELSAKELESILKRYRPTLGLQNVRIKALPNFL
jgi:hypothetical protein